MFRRAHALLSKHIACPFEQGSPPDVIPQQLHHQLVSGQLNRIAGCAATLEHSPGTCVEVCLTYLTPPLLERMHATEGAYTVVRLHNISLAVGATPASLRQAL